MTGMILNAQDEALVAVDDLSELVRGQEQSLLERMAPVVRRQTVTLDLGRVERIDAAGIAALISLYGCARDAGHHFTVTNATPRVAGILALVGLDRILVSHNAVRDSQYESCLEMPAA
jgi:anti-anti-sigma factor